MSRVTITNDNLAPLIEIFIWFCLVISVLTVVVRIIIKLKVVRKIGLDDHLIAISLLFAAAQSITLSVATSNGLGRALASLNVSQQSSQLKASYAATFLFIASTCFAKLSIVVFLRALTPVAIHRKFGASLGIIIILWAFTAILAHAFQCKPSRVWEYLDNMCFDRVAWANYVATANVLTDLGLIILPVFIVMSLKMAMNKKIAVLLAFMTRLGVIAAVICQLVFLNKLKLSSDPSLDIWPIALCTQLAQCLGILATCTIYLKPFLDSLESGFIQVADLRRQQTEGYGYFRKGSEFLNMLSSLTGKVSMGRSLGQSVELQGRWNASIGESPDQNETFVSSAGQAEPRDWDANSRSQILQTRTWAVHGFDGELGTMGASRCENLMA